MVFVEVVIVGGPHSSFNCEFQQQILFSVNLGFTVLMGKEDGTILVLKIIVFFVLVNYRGSLGFGKDSIDSLLGKIGTQDISDVHVRNMLVMLHFLCPSL